MRANSANGAQADIINVIMDNNKNSTVCPRSLGPSYIENYYKKWDNTSWTYCSGGELNKNLILVHKSISNLITKPGLNNRLTMNNNAIIMYYKNTYMCGEH